MNILDIIIMICFIPILISGYKKGFINQTISIIALMTGVWLASVLGDTTGNWFLPMMEGNCDNPQGMAHLAGFAVTLVAVCVIFLLLGKVIENLILLVIPDIINKILGVGLSVANGILLLCVLYLIFNVLNKIYLFTDLKAALFSDSLLFPIIESTANTLLPNLLNILL